MSSLLWLRVSANAVTALIFGAKHGVIGPVNQGVDGVTFLKGCRTHTSADADFFLLKLDHGVGNVLPHFVGDFGGACQRGAIE